MTVEELFGRVAVTYVQTTRLKVSAPVPIQVSNARLRGPASRSTGCRRLRRRPSTTEGTMTGNQAGYTNTAAAMETTLAPES